MSSPVKHAVGRPRLMVADDHTLLLEGFKLMLEPEFELIGTVEDGQALLTEAQRLKPDIVLLDISMPLMNGIAAARQLTHLSPLTKLIFVTQHSDINFVKEAFRAGAAGYLLKQAAASELLTAIREVIKGRHYVSPLVARDTIAALLGSSKPADEAFDPLTPRQREVLQLVAEGRSRKEIAAALTISIKTVEFHKSAIMRQLDLHTSSDLTRYALEHGIVGQVNLS